MNEISANDFFVNHGLNLLQWALSKAKQKKTITMNKIVGIIALTFGLSGALSAGAQVTVTSPSKAPRKELSMDQKVDHHVKKRTKQLSLTEEQQQQWRASAMQFEEQKAAMKRKKQTASTPEEKKAARQEAQQIKSSWDTQVLSILNEEQEVKWAQIQSEEKANRQKRRSEKKQMGEGK